jgi:hypothetical protein
MIRKLKVVVDNLPPIRGAVYNSSGYPLAAGTIGS